MYRIAILTDDENLGKQIAGWTGRFWKEHGCFPQIKVLDNREILDQIIRETAPCGVIAVLPGVGGLNEAEHLRSLCPQCRLIWCSDLDFSLHAYRIRADYFILGSVTEEKLRRGLAVWRERR